MYKPYLQPISGNPEIGFRYGLSVFWSKLSQTRSKTLSRKIGRVSSLSVTWDILSLRGSWTDPRATSQAPAFSVDFRLPGPAAGPGSPGSGSGSKHSAGYMQTGSPGNGSGSKHSAGYVKSQPRRPNLRPVPAFGVFLQKEKSM